MTDGAGLQTLPGQLFLPVIQSLFCVSGYRWVAAVREARKGLMSCMARKRRLFQCINCIWAAQLLKVTYHIFVALVP